MTTQTFQLGDTVKLKSDSPKMTIDHFVWNANKGVYETDRVVCIWFDAQGKHQDMFHTHSLVKIG